MLTVTIFKLPKTTPIAVVAIVVKTKGHTTLINLSMYLKNGYI